MSVNLSPIGNDAPFLDSSGNPLSGGKLNWYVANSSTPQDTYTTSAGNVANANPVVLGTGGYPTVASAVVEIWLTAGVSYKCVLTDSNGVVIWTRDYISGINDTTVAQNEWISGPAPTYVSATSFTLVGDQTSTFQVGRRIKTTNTAGTIYSTIATSAYGALTTITVTNDSGTLDSGLSGVSYGLLAATNRSTPPLGLVLPLTGVSGTNTIIASASLESAPLIAGQVFSFVPANTNTGATTINVNGQGAKSVVVNGAACVGGEVVASAQAIIIYDGTQFNLITDLPLRGTFAPTVTLVGGAANTVPVYSTNTGRYTKIGNRVFVDVLLSGDGGAEGAGTGVLTIAIPITSSASAPAIDSLPVGTAVNGTTIYFLYGTIGAGGGVISLSYANLINSLASMTGADQNNATRSIRLRFFYEV